MDTNGKKFNKSQNANNGNNENLNQAANLTKSKETPMEDIPVENENSMVNCPACTYLNPKTAFLCEACNSSLANATPAQQKV